MDLINLNIKIGKWLIAPFTWLKNTVIKYITKEVITILNHDKCNCSITPK